MKSKLLIVLTVGLFCVIFATFIGCTKNNPNPPIYDTVTITKHDTTTDTLYSPKPDSTVNLTRGLLLYLPFSGNIADSSGNNNPTTATANVLTYDAHGYANSAFGATGNGEKVYVTNNGSIKFDTAFSLSFGFMVNVSGADQGFISMVDPVTGYGPTFLIGNTFAGIPFLDDGVNDITSGCSVYGSISNVNVADTTNFEAVGGSWYNAILIYHKGTTKTYINGTLIGTRIGTGTEAQLCPASQIVVGAWWNGDPRNLNGKLDNIRLYNRVLTPHEITALSSNYQITSNSVKATPKTAY